MTDRDFWIAIREALLLIVSAIERLTGTTPTTKECREFMRRMNRGTR